MPFPRGARRATFPKPPYGESGVQYSVKLHREEYDIIERVANQQRLSFTGALCSILLDWEKKRDPA